jgi:hypothetical protein
MAVMHLSKFIGEAVEEQPFKCGGQTPQPDQAISLPTRGGPEGLSTKCIKPPLFVG